MSGVRGLFVTGTDTGVGKTQVACALVRGLCARGIDVGVIKPIETGVGEEGPLDALALLEASGSGDPLEDVCPQRFALPAAPTVAARHERREVDLGAVKRAFGRIRSRHECVIAEGAGGLLVPAAEGVSMADLARELALPVLVVARASLGTINHTLLTLEVAVARGLPVAGVVISHPELISPADEANLVALREALGAGLLAELPHCAPGEKPVLELLADTPLADGPTRPD